MQKYASAIQFKIYFKSIYILKRTIQQIMYKNIEFLFITLLSTAIYFMKYWKNLKANFILVSM